MTIEHASRNGQLQQYVAMLLDNQLFGIPVASVHDVLQNPSVNPVPLAPSEVAGSLNLRGRIVNAVDLRQRLSLGNRTVSASQKVMCVVIEHRHEMYGLLVDSVRDVLSLDEADYEKLPSTVDPRWRDVCSGIYKLDKELLLVLELGKLFSELEKDAA